MYSSLFIEASGHFDEHNVKQFQIPNVDCLTTDRMFGGYSALDFTLNYEACDSSSVLKQPGSLKRAAGKSSTTLHGQDFMRLYFSGDQILILQNKLILIYILLIVLPIPDHCLLLL